jgi:hypothetical protein
MSALGQKQTCAEQNGGATRDVRFVPIADMAQTQVQFFISPQTDGLRGLHQLMAVTAIQTREPSNDER